jgi:hypothetical protein
MDTPDERAATAATGAGHGPLLRRPEVRRWAHHVADLNSGEVHTDVLEAPPTSTSRVAGLSRLGSVGGTTIFNGPSFVLTTRIPYVASPEAGWWPVSTTQSSGRDAVDAGGPSGAHEEPDLLLLPAAGRAVPAHPLIGGDRVGHGGHVSVGWVPHDLGGYPKTRTWSATRSRVP